MDEKLLISFRDWQCEIVDYAGVQDVAGMALFNKELDELIAAIRADERAKVLAEQATLMEKVKPLVRIIASTPTNDEHYIKHGYRYASPITDTLINQARDVHGALKQVSKPDAFDHHAAQMRACAAKRGTNEST